MRFQILGPVTVEVGGGEVTVTASRDRTLLGVLLLHANRTVGRDQLVDLIWPGRPPQDARNQLQGCVSRLRKRFAAAGMAPVIVTEPDGYRAVVAPADLDMLEFRRLVARARDAAGEGRYEDAAADFRAGLALWRGPVLAGLDGHAIVATIAGLEEERVRAIEERLAAELAGGSGAELVAELTELVERHPLREEPHRALMLALYRAGRQADALAAYRRARKLLDDELGTEPGPALRELHQAILNGDPALDAAPAGRTAVPRPRQLPSDVAGFSGRVEPLKVLDEMLARRPAASGPVVISAIAGTAGIGKTALAVHWAHLAADQFPDGQLYVNLRGFDPGGTPVEPAVAVRGFLDALAVPPERVPTDPDAQVSLYRSLLAERRILVVLDNARDPDHVRPLLPGAPGCMVLVTSRQQLGGLMVTDGAVPLPIDPMPDDEARQLLAARLGPERVAAEPAAVADLLDACAGLPLALAIVAARAAASPRATLAAIAEEVRRAGTGLSPWSGEDPASDLRAVFSWSYEALDPDAARLFRLLGLHPGPDLAAPAAASLAAVPLPRARRHLAALTEANLVSEHTPGRWTMHDLVRAYAAEVTAVSDSEPDRRMAQHRMLDHYLHSAHVARVQLDPSRTSADRLAAPQPGSVVTDMKGPGQAWSWFTTEIPALVRVIEQAALKNFDMHVVRIVARITIYFHHYGLREKELVVQGWALLAAQRMSDRSAEGSAHYGLGNALADLRRYDDAWVHFQQALQMHQEVGDLRRQAYVHLNLGALSAQRRDYDEALRCAGHAEQLFTNAGDRAGQARALNLTGWAQAHLGDLLSARGSCEEALAIQSDIGDAFGACITWDSLGYVHHLTGDYTQAIGCFERALADSAQPFRFARAEALHHLADAHYALGHVHAAQSAWQTALNLLRALNHPDAEQVVAKLEAADQAHCGLR